MKRMKHYHDTLDRAFDLAAGHLATLPPGTSFGYPALALQIAKEGSITLSQGGIRALADRLVEQGKAERLNMRTFKVPGGAEPQPQPEGRGGRMKRPEAAVEALQARLTRLETELGINK